MKSRGIISKWNYVAVELPPLANVAPDIESEIPMSQSKNAECPKNERKNIKKNDKKQKEYTLGQGSQTLGSNKPYQHWPMFWPAWDESVGLWQCAKNLRSPPKLARVV